MFISYQQNIKQNHIIKTADKFIAMWQRSSIWKWQQQIYMMFTTY